MPKLKVKQLKSPMIYLIDFPDEQPFERPDPVPENFPLIGRDGFYCRGEDVWWEYKGKGYLYGRTLKCRPDFVYDLTVNDEAILMKREANAMKIILKTTRDATVRKTVSKRLRLHEEAVYLRNIKRGIRH